MLNSEVKLYEQQLEETVLPICFPSPIKAYLPVSIVSNIITANSNNYNWIMYHFTQIFKGKNKNKVETFPFQSFMYFDQAGISCTCIDQNVMDIKQINLIEDIIKWIDKNNYVVVYLNEGMLAQTRLYKNKNMLHSQFIFGYNKSNRTFKVLNFPQDSNELSILDIPFESLSDVFYSDATLRLYKEKDVSNNLKGKEFCIQLLKYKNKENESIYQELNLNIIKDNIKQYALGINSSLNTNYFTDYVEGSWGIDVYDEIILMLNEEKMDFRMFYLLCEHKIYMQQRLTLFDEKISAEYNSIVNKATILKGLCFKYYIKKSMTIIEKMIHILNELKEEEFACLKSMV